MSVDRSQISTLADYHMHTPLCKHAEGLPEAYACAAIDAGLKEVGFSDHNPMAEIFDDWRMEYQQFPHYLDLIQKVQAQFSNQLTIRLGLECDFLPGQESWIKELSKHADFDYLIGSVHYLNSDWAVDDPDPKWASRWNHSIDDIWQQYWDLYRQCAASRLFDFLAHPDLVKKFGHRPEGDLKRFYEPTIEVIAANNLAIEISTAGLRKPCAEIYPSREFLELAFKADIPIVISSDAHHPNEVGSDFPIALTLAKEVGYTNSARFHKRERTLVPFDS
ncbi:MAG: histidinol-phosphatase HisJ family protein [Verrucomicrobiales bacterium]|nr:histidinol-phosphatase HisJ family protein [Verrucomicrobiales bacterium]